MIRHIAVLCIACMTAGPAVANDSSVGLGAGGLEFQTTDAVAILSEDLHITPEEVRVTYVMRNLTEAPVTLDIGFPLPPLPPFSDEFNPSIPFPEQANFVGFTTRVDGEAVTLTPHVQALVDGTDHAALLAEYDLPPVPVLWNVAPALEALDPAVLARLQAVGLVDGLAPQWELRVTFLRSQTFAPGRDVVVEHRYAPIAGGSVGAPLYPGVEPETSEWHAAYADRFCWDEAMEARAARLARGIADVEGAITYLSDEVDYILTTGRNWAGPIGRFSLVVEGPSEMDMVALCLPGVTYVSQSRAEFTAADFLPEQDLAVYVYRAVPPQDAP